MDMKIRMMEKYLHSMGALMLREGRIPEAISFLERAIALDDRSYTRCDLANAFARHSKWSRAVAEIDRAITLDPSVAKYHEQKSRFHQAIGDEREQADSLRRAIELDPNYGRIGDIRQALKAIEAGISGQPDISRLSCILPCPAFCCHFEGSPLLHGLTIGAWKLSEIRKTLGKEGNREEEFLDRTELAPWEQEVRQMVPPHHLLREKGGACVYSPRQGRSALPPASLTSRPKGRGYEDLLWIDEDSRACAFLVAGRCTIHDIGDEPALPACKDFFCLTGLIFVLLAAWNLVKMESIVDKTMDRLNGMAVDALLVLGREIYRAEGQDSLQTRESRARKQLAELMEGA